MGQPEFVHLHNHTEYSRQDGLQKLGPMCKAAAADSQRAIAVTDHGTKAAMPKFVKAAAEAGIKPILGEEVYLAIGSRKDHGTLTDFDDGSEADETSLDGRKERKYHHLTVLAADPTGWRNLVTLGNDAADHFWHKPRTDLDILTELNEGLILGSGCLGGPVASRFLSGDDQGAHRALEDLLAVVDGDKDRLFVEIMSHGIAEEDRLVTPKLIEAANRFGLRLVASNDAHYTDGCEHDGPPATHAGHGCHPEAHDLLLALGTNSHRDATDRYRFNGHGYHLRTAAEMDAVFSRIPGADDAVRNSLMVAEMVEPDVMPPVRYHLPKYPVPACDVAEFEALRASGDTRFDNPSHYYYVKKLREGAVNRYGTTLPERVRAHLNRETKVIHGAGMDDYMLIVGGVLGWAREQGIVTGPGRGSAVGSTSAYATGITDVEPIAHNLLFERFLDPSRVGMPDVDSDFEQVRRPEVLQHITQTYGADRVALIGTRGTYKARGSLRHVGRLTDRTDTGAALAEQVWSKAGKDATLAQLNDPGVVESTGFREALTADPEAPTLLSLASIIEGTRSDVGIHACGVLVCDESMLDQVPMRRDRSSGMWVTEWEGPELEALGYLKLDVLGLRTLNVVSGTLNMMRASGIETPDITYRGMEVDPTTSPRARKAWEMIGAGDTEGVFQLASDGMRRLAQQVQPQNIDDLSALVALYRPGPMGAGMHDKYGDRKHGREPVSYDYLTTRGEEQAVIASVLDNTMGLIIYQESVMSLSGVVAGFGPSDKNRLRKAFSKKKKEEMDALREKFISGATSVTEDGPDSTASIAFAETTAVELWRTFDASASYIFNASHSVAYGFLGYITAFLKANWPSHFGAATLASTSDDTKRVDTLGSLRRQGIEVRPPSVVDGRASTWVADDGAVVLGLAEVDGVGEDAAAIVAEREACGPFRSLSDLVNRVKVRTARPSEEKVETRSHTTDICHRCLSVRGEDPPSDDVSAFGVCTCGTPARFPPEGEDPVPRTWTCPDGTAVAVKAVKAGKNHKLSRTERTPVLDEHGQPVMTTSNLSLGLVESLIKAGACDAFGPRLGQLAVVRSLREVPDLPVPDVEAGVIERERLARTKLGVTIGKGPFGDARVGRALLDWDIPDPGRQAQIVGVHQVRHPGWYLVGGVLDRYGQRYTRKGSRMAYFTLSDSKDSMPGVMWESSLEASDGATPRVGDVVVMSAKAQDRTITRSVQTEDASLDTVTGETYEPVTERVTVRELSAEQVYVFPGDVGARNALTVDSGVPMPRVYRGGAPVALVAAREVGRTLFDDPEPEPEPVEPRPGTGPVRPSVVSLTSDDLDPMNEDIVRLVPGGSSRERNDVVDQIERALVSRGGFLTAHDFTLDLAVPGPDGLVRRPIRLRWAAEGPNMDVLGVG